MTNSSHRYQTLEKSSRRPPDLIRIYFDPSNFAVYFGVLVLNSTVGLLVEKYEMNVGSISICVFVGVMGALFGVLGLVGLEPYRFRRNSKFL